MPNTKKRKIIASFDEIIIDYEKPTVNLDDVSEEKTLFNYMGLVARAIYGEVLPKVAELSGIIEREILEEGYLPAEVDDMNERIIKSDKSWEAVIEIFSDYVELRGGA